MAKERKKTRGVYPRKFADGIWWCIDFTDQTGQRHREKVSRLKVEAVAIYAQRTTEVRQNKFDPDWVKGKHKNVLFSEIVEDRRIEASTTLKSFRQENFRLNWLKEYFQGKSVASITTEDVREMKEDLREEGTKGQGLSVSSTNHFLASLRTTFMEAIRKGKAKSNPVTGKGLFEKPDNERCRFLSDDEEARLMAVLPPALGRMLQLSIHTGLRKRQLLRLEWSHLNFQLRQITVPAKNCKARKGQGKEYKIPMNDVALEILQKTVRVLGSPWVYPGEDPSKPQVDLPRLWEEYVERAGIEDYTWHDNRHTFASRLIMKGVDLYTVSKLLGHADVKMTRRYAHLSPDFLKGAVDVLVAKKGQIEGQTGTTTAQTAG